MCFTKGAEVYNFLFPVVLSQTAAQKAAEVVPGAHTSWLVLLVLAEAMQFVALPFAAAIGWDESFILGFVPQVTAVAMNM